jgi:ATP-dependent helicase HepA
MVLKPPKYNLHDWVRKRHGDKVSGMIMEEPIQTDSGWQYKVFFGGNIRRYVDEKDLEFVVPEAVKLGGASDLLRQLLLVKLKTPLADHLYGAYASRTEFQVYQFKPALKFLGNPDQRILIADEVGLGKTIEAGIIYLELQARLDLSRVLIICPPALKYKWQDEMRSRFDEKFSILDRQALEHFFDDYQRAGDLSQLRGIVTLHLIRRKEIAAQLAEMKINFDLVIIDEAHHLRNPNTLSNNVASVISENADAMLFLTATPLHLGNQDLFHLLNILSPGEFDNLEAFKKRIQPNMFINHVAELLKRGEYRAAYQLLINLGTLGVENKTLNHPYYLDAVKVLANSTPSRDDLVQVQRNLLELNSLSHIFTRTRKREVMIDAPHREAHTIKFSFTDDEQAYYEAVIDYVKKEYQEKKGSVVHGWVTMMRERQAASCISALRKQFDDVLKDRYRVTTEEIVELNNLTANIDEDEEENIDIDTAKYMQDIASQKLSQLESLENLIHLGNNIDSVDTKFDFFVQALKEVFLQEPTSKVLVFAFFRGTLDYLYKKLKQMGYQVQIIHGDIKLPERKSNVDQFRDDPTVQILLSSEVGSEGLDFQFCNTIFNYDLPWNPMKVEQRIGRLDRFGQKHKRINIYNLVIENSIEERIFMRLYERIGIFKAAIGDLEAILGDEIKKISRTIFSSKLTPEQEKQLAEQAAESIIRLEKEMEVFEKERQYFMGQDAIFRDEVENAIGKGKYITGNEIKALVAPFIRKNYPQSHFESDAEDPTCFLMISDDLRKYIRDFIILTRPNDQIGKLFLQRITESREVPVTFSAEIAYERKIIEFINFRHPLTLAALEYWKNHSEEEPLFKIFIKNDTPPFGIFYFFVFLLHYEGLDRKSQLISVVVDKDELNIQEDLNENFLTLVQRVDPDQETESTEFDQYAFDKAKRGAIQYMAFQRDEKFEDLRRSNNALIDSRIGALDQTFYVKQAKVKEYLDTAADDRIIRMRKAQLRNIETNYRKKVAEVERGRNLTVTFQYEFAGVMRIDPHSENMT